MVYLEKPPAVEQLEADYAWERTFEMESEQRNRRNPVLYRLGRLPKQTLQRLTKRDKLLQLAKRYIQAGPVLDVGCAGGHTLANFPDRFVPYGIEVSHELSQIARKAFELRGGSVIQGDSVTGLGQFPAAQFTGIIMTSFLEHDVNARETLSAARRVMRADAALIVKVPNYASWNRSLRGPRWCGFRSPDHVNYFTPELLNRLLLDTGFKTVRNNLFDKLPTSDTMWLVAKSAAA